MPIVSDRLISPIQASSPTLKLVPAPLLVAATELAIMPAAVNVDTVLPPIPTVTLPFSATATLDVPFVILVPAVMLIPVS